MNSASFDSKKTSKNQIASIKIFQDFQNFSQKVLQQLNTFSALQMQLDQLVLDSNHSKTAQKKLQKLESNDFFQKNEQLFSALENFCHHLSNLSKQMRQLSLFANKKSTIPTESKKLLPKPSIKSPKTSLKSKNLNVKTGSNERAPSALENATTNSTPIEPPSLEKATSTTHGSSTRVKLPRVRKNIIAIPGGFL